MPSALSAFAFFERGGGVPTEHQISANPSVGAFIQEAMASGRTAPERTKPKAHRTLVALLVGLEALVVDDGQLQYPRMYA